MDRRSSDHSEEGLLAEGAAGARTPGIGWERLVLGSALAGAAGIFGYYIRHTSIWYDEAITLLTTSGHALPDWSLGMQLFEPTPNPVKILVGLFKFDVHPPLYFWIAGLWRFLLGGSLEVTRCLSALFILATGLLLYRVAAARQYAIAAFFILLTLDLGNRKSRWTGVCASACVATHYFAALCAAPMLLIFCVWRWKTDRRWAVMGLAWFAILCCPLLAMVSKFINIPPTYRFRGFGPWPGEVAALARGAVAAVAPGSSYSIARKLTVLAFAGFAAAGAWNAVRRKAWVAPAAYAAFLGGFFLLAAASHQSVLRMPADYYLGLAAPLLALLLGFGVSALPRTSLVLALLMMVSLLSRQPVIAAMAGLNIDYRRMVLRMRSECPDCPIVVGAGFGRGVPGCVVYEARARRVFVLGPNDTIDGLVSRTGGPGVIYFIPSHEAETAQVENALTASFLTEPQGEYFRIDTAHRLPP